MEGKWVVGALIVMVVMVVGGQASASATPNSYWSCMRDCPGYNCAHRSAQDCWTYCGIACAIPPANLAAEVAANHYCNLGCTSSKKCFNLDNNKADVVPLTACINDCSNICATKPSGTSALAAN